MGTGNQGTSAAVTDLMAKALQATARPAEVLERVCAMVAPKSGADLGGIRRKLTPAQAARAATCVTSIMTRLHVKPADACRAAGVATSANNFHGFHLTERERLLGPDATFKPDRFNQSLNHYHRLVMETARLAAEEGASVDRPALLDELAEAVGDFLLPFVPAVERTVFEEISEHLNLIGSYFSKPRMGPAGTLVDLPRLRDACERASLAYSHTLDAMAYAGEGPGENWTGNLPRLLLLPRVVGRVAVTCTVPDEDGDVSGTPSSILELRQKTIGSMDADLLYGVSLALTAAPGGRVAMRFLLEPWTAIVRGPRSQVRLEEGQVHIWLEPAEIMVRGFPFTDLTATDHVGPFQISADGVPSARCPEFARWIASSDDDGDPDAIGAVRTLPVTPETCELFLGSVRRTQLWDFERPFKADMVLKDWVELHGGVPNCETVERIAERLYRDDEQSLDRMLLAKAEVIAAAMDRHVEGAADGASRKRAAFLRRMRS